MSTTSWGTESLAKFVQAAGSALGHCALSALVRQVRILEPAVLTVMPVVTRHCAALPRPKAPSAVTQSGIWVSNWRPLMDPILAHALGNDTEHVPGVGPGVQAAPPPAPGADDCRPRDVSRQAMMPAPVVLEVTWDVARQVSVDPMAYGPRAATQSATSGRSARPVSVRSLVQAAGSAVMHWLLRELVRQVTMVEPAVVNPMADWLRQVRVLPAAKGPRAIVQPARSGIMASPFARPMLLQAAGSPVAHADGAGPVLVVEQLVVVVDEVVVVEGVVVVADELLEVVVLLVVDVGVVALGVVEDVVLLVMDVGVVVAGVVDGLLLLLPLVDVGPVVEEEHPPLGSPRPIEVRRHDSTFKGFVMAVVRHCATAPTAKGPRAVVH